LQGASKRSHVDGRRRSVSAAGPVVVQRWHPSTMQRRMRMLLLMRQNLVVVRISAGDSGGSLLLLLMLLHEHAEHGCVVDRRVNGGRCGVGAIRVRHCCWCCSCGDSGSVWIAEADRCCRRVLAVIVIPALLLSAGDAATAPLMLGSHLDALPGRGALPSSAAAAAAAITIATSVVLLELMLMQVRVPTMIPQDGAAAFSSSGGGVVVVDIDFAADHMAALTVLHHLVVIADALVRVAGMRRIDAHRILETKKNLAIYV